MGSSQALEITDVVDFRTDQRLSRGTRAFLKALNTPAPPELEKLAPIAARKVLETAQASVNVDYSGIDEREKTITVDGFEIALNIVRPKSAAGKLPVFVFIHGGGWVLGDYPTHRRLVRDLVVESGYCAVFVDYTRTPDAVFPRQIDEIYAAFCGNPASARARTRCAHRRPALPPRVSHRCARTAPRGRAGDPLLSDGTP